MQRSVELVAFVGSALLLMCSTDLVNRTSGVEATYTLCYCNTRQCGVNRTCEIDDDDHKQRCSVSFASTPPVYDCMYGDSKDFFSGLRCENEAVSVTRCCRSDDHCNLNLTQATTPAWPLPTTPPVGKRGKDKVSVATVAAISGIALCIMIVSGAVVLYCRARQKRWEADGRQSAVHRRPLHDDDDDPDTGRGNDSGSGRGERQFEIRTITRQFESLTQISTGRYSDIFKAQWRGRFVTVKMFKLMDEEAFKWEKDLYCMYGLHHNHLVDFIAADTRCQLETQQWLVTAHHDNGTLRRYLRDADRPHDFVLACRLGRSIASGIAYLHSSIAGAERAKSHSAAAGGDFMGTGNKPSIAHCALSSDVILIKDDMTCCLSDLTMATQLSGNSIHHSEPVLAKSGAFCYMAPELLAGTINTGLFESYRQLDMYAFALLLWEILWCCPVRGRGLQQPHRLPFEGIVHHDASPSDWTQVVSVMHVRPPVCEEWRNGKPIARYTNLMKSCWNSHPNGRRTALNATKTLQSCLEEYSSDYGSPVTSSSSMSDTFPVLAVSQEHVQRTANHHVSIDDYLCSLETSI